jgi:small-conductance mechanosensitive channel
MKTKHRAQPGVLCDAILRHLKRALLRMEQRADADEERATQLAREIVRSVGMARKAIIELSPARDGDNVLYEQLAMRLACPDPKAVEEVARTVATMREAMSG